MTGEIDGNAVISSYQPSGDELDFTLGVRDDWAKGEEILNRSWAELNNRSVLEDENWGQMMFNAFVDTEIEDENKAWEYRGTRSKARNKGIHMHANLTAAFLIPLFVAQNETDEVDRDFSDYMRGVVEWMTYPENSDYQSSFLNVAFGMMDSPVTFLGAEFCEVSQTVREMQDDGTYTTKEILDEVLSGFKAPVYRANQVLITNAYERNIQKQRRIIPRRYIEYSEAEALYGEHPNWVFVQKGIRSVYNEGNGLFYDIKDDDHPDLVEEALPQSRRDDLEVPYINGIYMGNPDDVEGNPIRHRDNKNAPKYNWVPFGYHRIGRHFFYYKSMMNIMRWDNELYDAATAITTNRAILEANMPVAFSGTDGIDTDVVFPGSVVTMESAEARATPLLPNSNLTPLYKTLELTGDSMSDASISDTAEGQLPDASQKAYTVAQAAAASKKIIQGAGKSLAESVLMYGDLMKDIAIHNITAPEAEEIVGKGVRLRYKTFLIPNKKVGGRTMDKMFKFDESLLGMELTEDEKKYKNLKLLEGTEYPDNKQAIYHINPEFFAKFKYYTKVDLEEMFQMNKDMMGALWQGLFTILKDDPYISQEDLRRNLLRPYQAEDLVIKPEENTSPMNPAANPSGAPSSPIGNMVVNKALSTALPNAGA